MALAAGIAWLFYRSAWALIPLSPLVALSLMAGRNQRREERRRQLAVQFREGLTALCAALSAGYSVENATAEAARELRSMYGEEGLMVREMELLGRKIGMNCPVEKAFGELAERSGLEDIRQLADVFAIAKRSGGDLVKILGKTAGTLRTRSQLREEILTLMAGKRLEQRIMSVMPAAVLLYVNLGNPGFTDPLYQGIGGRCIMSVCLVVYGLAVRWGSRIVNGALQEGI